MILGWFESQTLWYEGSNENTLQRRVGQKNIFFLFGLSYLQGSCRLVFGTPKKFQLYAPINNRFASNINFGPFLECKNGPKYAKIEFWPENLVGTCWNHLVSTAELHFYRSFQGYPTCPYFFWIWSDGHMAIWPYLAIFGHIWPYGHRTICDKYGQVGYPWKDL